MVPASTNDDRSALSRNVLDDGPRHVSKLGVIYPSWWKDAVRRCESAQPEKVDQLFDERCDPFVFGLNLRFRELILSRDLAHEFLIPHRPLQTPAKIAGDLTATAPILVRDGEHGSIVGPHNHLRSSQLRPAPNTLQQTSATTSTSTASASLPRGSRITRRTAASTTATGPPRSGSIDERGTGWVARRRYLTRQLRSERESMDAFSDVILRRSSSGTPLKIRSRNSRDFGHVDSACGKSLPQSMLSTPMTSRSLRP